MKRRDADSPYYHIAILGPEIWNGWLLEALGPESLASIAADTLKQWGPLSAEQRQKLAQALRNGRTLDPRKMDFSDLIFSEEMDFSHFIFPAINNGDRLPFGGAVFQKFAHFSHAKFLSKAAFSGAEFQHGVDFDSVDFFDGATFAKAIFQGSSFQQARFHSGRNLLADFSECHFYDFVEFGSAEFEAAAHFRDSQFYKLASFNSVRFRESATFSRCKFLDTATFDDEVAFVGHAFFDSCQFGGIASFNSARFDDLATFNNSRFERAGRFYGARFKVAPEFHGANLHEDTSFTDAVFPEPEHSEDDRSYWDSRARAFRTLRLAMNQLQAHEEELAFFASEMRARACLEPRLRRLSAHLYDSCSDFGRSVQRPLAILAVTYVLAVVLDLLLSSPLASARSPDPPFWAYLARVGQVCAFSAAGSLPLLGQARMASELAHTLFEDRVVPWVYFVSLAQGTVSAAALFLILLALRNQFRIK
jgi:uncharacterized protein YjbI with pentapeptide repeats